MSEGQVIVLERVRRVTNWRILVLGLLAMLGLGVLVAIIVLQQRTDQERDRAVALQQHTFEVVIRANQLSVAVSAAEAALGRYVVSADKTLGQQYSAQWGRAAEQLARLQQLTRDSPRQQGQIAQLRRAFEVRGRELSETALYSTYKRHNDAWGSYYRVRQSPARQAVETLLTRIVDSERVLLRDRTRAAGDLIDNSSFASRILTGFGVMIVVGAVLLGWLAIAAEGERAAADAEATAQRERAAELQLAVDAATADLRAEAHERAHAEAQLRQVQKMEAVGQLTGGIAHDFNNMLAVVLGGLELAKRHLHTGGPDAQQHIENAMEGANRAAALTRRLLAFSRSEPLLPEPVEAGGLIAGMSDLLDRTLGDTIKVKTRDAGKQWAVWVDRHQLENALLNLAVNARDAMEGRGTLTITTDGATLEANQVGECPAGDYVTITVADTGCGMTPEVLDRVFEPFFTTKPVGKGTGLGLSQIFGFVRQSGGEIGIETVLGGGTKVMVYLPRHTGEAATEALEAPAPAPALAAPVMEEAVPAKVYDILVVEDDPRVLGATVGALQELGHRVTSCSDPLAAPVAVAGMASLDLVISDVLMPGQTGPEMIASLGERLDGVAVLFVTGFAGEAEADMFGGRGVLRKPFTMASLSRAVNEAVEYEARRGTQQAA
ncbi:ATP-binding protein [Sphingomonas sp. UNC305MFCol5.2]|uniref:ATP-binding protein n=1 Tax=Sphingomonas sp. UNC305MFCol5.2 TaxID=1449076 RepID=UPI0004A755F1|nr:ATP-binding protein [Sphingomonas sp. UNC305MFCol5.2]